MPVVKKEVALINEAIDHATMRVMVDKPGEADEMVSCGVRSHAIGNIRACGPPFALKVASINIPNACE